jgi:hypothetical protein
MEAANGIISLPEHFVKKKTLQMELSALLSGLWRDFRQR